MSQQHGGCTNVRVGATRGSVNTGVQEKCNVNRRVKDFLQCSFVVGGKISKRWLHGTFLFVSVTNKTIRLDISKFCGWIEHRHTYKFRSQKWPKGNGRNILYYADNFEAFHSVHSCSQTLLFIRTKCTYYVKYVYLSPATSYMFRYLLHNLQGDHCVTCPKTVCFLQCCYTSCAMKCKWKLSVLYIL